MLRPALDSKSNPDVRPKPTLEAASNGVADTIDPLLVQPILCSVKLKSESFLRGAVSGSAGTYANLLGQLPEGGESEPLDPPDARR